MKTLTTLLITILATTAALSQDLEKCEETVGITIEAINQNSSTELESRIAENFSIAGQTGDIAKLVLSQLFSQLNEEVLTTTQKSAESNNDGLTLIYDIEYAEMGTREATFIFNSSSQLEQLELFDMQVKTMDSESKITGSSQNFVTIPFEMAGNLIAVDVNLNGESKKFILDSGAPRVILNSRYLETDGTNAETISQAKGVSGSISGMDIQKVSSLEFAGISMDDQDVLTLDLTHLEEELETEFYGLIGYELLKEYDLLFDYESQEFTLIKPEYFDKYKAEFLPNHELTSIPMDLADHIPVISVEVGDTTLNLGIDCGAETNLFDDDLFADVEGQIKNKSEDTLIGADNNAKKVQKGLLNSMKIGDKELRDLPTSFNDISHLNEAYQVQIDGLVGHPILSRQKTLLSYANKQLIFID